MVLANPTPADATGRQTMVSRDSRHPRSSQEADECTCTRSALLEDDDLWDKNCICRTKKIAWHLQWYRNGKEPPRYTTETTPDMTERSRNRSLQTTSGTLAKFPPYLSTGVAHPPDLPTLEGRLCGGLRRRRSVSDGDEPFHNCTGN